MQILSNLLAFLFAAGLVIFVHEAGHWLVGRLCGARVLVFSLGFGGRIWGFRRGDTDYRLSAIPLGGYVSFDGQDPAQSTSDPAAFSNRPRWQRIAIYLAGPAMNLVLAIVLVAGVFMVGTDLADQRSVSTEIGRLAPQGAAARAGLQVGDRILALDGNPVADWQTVSLAFLTSPRRAVEVRYRRDGEELNTTVVPDPIPRYELGDAGVGPIAPARVVEAQPGSPAAKAGLRFGDRLLSVDGSPVSTVDQFRELVAPNAGRELTFVVEREGKAIEFTATPEDRDGRGVLGVVIDHFQFTRLAPAAAFRESLRYNWDTTKDLFSFLGKVFARKIPAQGAIGGPIEIAKMSGAAARRRFRDLLFFVALISLNLCILNLLPIPILDGGQISILCIESVLRRDLSLTLRERITQVGLVMIVLLMAMALYFDLLKSWPVSKS